MSRAKCKIKKGRPGRDPDREGPGGPGEVLRVLPTERRVVVAGVNIATKHVKPSQKGPGGIERVERPLHISNVALADPKTGAPTRVGYTVLKDEKKVRVAKKSGETL